MHLLIQGSLLSLLLSQCPRSIVYHQFGVIPTPIIDLWNPSDDNSCIMFRFCYKDNKFENSNKTVKNTLACDHISPLSLDYAYRINQTTMNTYQFVTHCV